jgi:hypothetical protein
MNFDKGGVFNFNLIDMPDLPKIVDPWIMRTSNLYKFN